MDPGTDLGDNSGEIAALTAFVIVLLLLRRATRG
jgi:hypothetical protein